VAAQGPQLGNLVAVRTVPPHAIWALVFRHRHFVLVLAAECTPRRIAKIFPNPLDGQSIFRAGKLTSTV
jgi:hypothetical protein